MSRPNRNWNRTMNTTAKFLSVLAALAATTAWAAEPAPHAAHHPAPAATSMPVAKAGAPMMGAGKTNMADMHGLGMSAARLAALKGELALTPAQLPLWDTFADEARAMAAGMAMHSGMEMPMGKPMAPGTSMPQDMAMPKYGMAMMGRPGSLPERLDSHRRRSGQRVPGPAAGAFSPGIGRRRAY